MKDLLICAALVLIAIASHDGIYAVAPAILNSDTAIQPLTADLMLKGQWTVFQFEDTYGGNALTALRAIWNSALFPLISGAEAYRGHFAFNYFVLTSVLAVLAYLLARSHVSRPAATATGVTAAVGLNFLFLIYGIDFHIACLIFGFLMLILASRRPSPWKQLSPGALALIGLACGLAHYTSRMSDIFIAAYLVPWAWLLSEARQRFGARTRTERALFLAGCALLFLYLYLQTFGAVLGTWRGRSVKLHADPNLTYAAALFGLIWVRNHARKTSRASLLKGCAFAGGFLLGFLPELITVWSRGLSLRHVPTSTLSGTFTGIGQIPGALRTLFTAGPSLLANCSLLLVVFALAVLLRRGRCDARLRAALLSVGLACLAFVVKRPYPDAPARYLLAIVPGMFLAFGLLFEELRRHRFALALVLLLLGGHLYDQLEQRRITVDGIRKGGTIDQDQLILESFRRENLKVVVTDDYWEANRRTLVSQWNPQFAAPGPEAALPPGTAALTRSEPRVGVLLRDGKPDESQFDIHGRSFRLTPLGHVGAYRLYLGQ